MRDHDPWASSATRFHRRRTPDLRQGDVLIVLDLNRLGQRDADLIELADDLESHSIGFRALNSRWTAPRRRWAPSFRSPASPCATCLIAQPSPTPCFSNRCRKCKIVTSPKATPGPAADRQPKTGEAADRLNLLEQVLPRRSRSGCRTTARRTRAASRPADRAADPDRPSDETHRCDSPPARTATARPSSMRNSSQRRLAPKRRNRHAKGPSRASTPCIRFSVLPEPPAAL